MSNTEVLQYMIHRVHDTHLIRLSSWIPTKSYRNCSLGRKRNLYISGIGQFQKVGSYGKVVQTDDSSVCTNSKKWSTQTDDRLQRKLKTTILVHFWGVNGRFKSEWICTLFSSSKNEVTNSICKRTILLTEMVNFLDIQKMKCEIREVMEYFCLEESPYYPFKRTKNIG